MFPGLPFVSPIAMETRGREGGCIRRRDTIFDSTGCLFSQGTLQGLSPLAANKPLKITQDKQKRGYKKVRSKNRRNLGERLREP